MNLSLFVYAISSLLLALVCGQSTSDPEPVFEEPPMNYIFGNLTCETFNGGGLCAPFLGPLGADIIVNHSRVSGIADYEQTAVILQQVLNQVAHEKCVELLVPLLCRYVFITCDPAFNDTVYQPICRRGCDVVSLFTCPLVWQLLISQLGILEFGIVDPPLCDPLGDANGGDAPDCIDTTDGGPIPAFTVTSDCFTGLGRGYSGTMNVTRTGKTCQAWDVQAPHQFILPSSQYVELDGGHNYCRNPGSRAPNGPWCFTTDPDTRWEYCDVPKCDPKPSCELYTGSVCYARGVIGKDYVFINNTQIDSTLTDQAYWEDAMVNFKSSLETTIQRVGAPQSCVDDMLSLLCFHTFPVCDYSSNTSVPRQICRSYCQRVRTGPCQMVWNNFLQLAALQRIRLPDCDMLPEAIGGTSPECFIPFNSTDRRENHPANSAVCYNLEDKGDFYNGTINVTESGRVCQKWDSNTPHIHPLTSLYRLYLEGHDYCRNPEGRGERPWCYTTDPTQRWEYCNINPCRAASESDSSDDEFPLVTVLVIIIPVLVGILIVLLIAFLMVWCCKERARGSTKLVAMGNDYQDAGHLRKEAFKLTCNKIDIYQADNLNPAYVQHGDLNVTSLTGGVDLPSFPRDNIVYISDLGQGNFGVVIKAEAKDIIADQETTVVAIKVLKEGANDQTKKDFFREAVLMHEFNHPNILKLLGVCIEEEPLCMLFEYMELGDLNGYLRKSCSVANGSQPNLISGSQDGLHNGLPMQKLVNMSINIVAGLEYLSQHHYVHRDLATRNCLVDTNFVVKIADFGLSQDIYATDYYRLGDSALLPIRWMPPEAIMHAKFTTQSDVWSFGVVLWEIFSGGAQPYFALSNEEVVEYVRTGNVLKCPPGAPSELYDLMVDCWATEPDDRPNATELHVGLRRWNPDISASLSDGLAQPNQGQYQNMATVKEMERKKSLTVKQQLNTQQSGSSEGSRFGSQNSESPTLSDTDVGVPLNP